MLSKCSPYCPKQCCIVTRWSFPLAYISHRYVLYTHTNNQLGQQARRGCSILHQSGAVLNVDQLRLTSSDVYLSPRALYPCIHLLNYYRDHPQCLPSQTACHGGDKHLQHSMQQPAPWEERNWNGTHTSDGGSQSTIRSGVKNGARVMYALSTVSLVHC